MKQWSMFLKERHSFSDNLKTREKYYYLIAKKCNFQSCQVVLKNQIFLININQKRLYLKNHNNSYLQICSTTYRILLTILCSSLSSVIRWSFCVEESTFSFNIFHSKLSSLEYHLSSTKSLKLGGKKEEIHLSGTNFKNYQWWNIKDIVIWEPTSR